MSENQSIKETLDIIRKALEEDDPPKISEDFDNLLVLNQLVREDGTIKILKEDFLTKKDTIQILTSKKSKYLPETILNIFFFKIFF